MTNATLLAALKERGVLCQINDRFDAFTDLTLEVGRVDCAEIRLDGSDGRRGFTGITFWVHAAGPIVLLGVWSGIEYRVPDGEDLLGLIVDMFESPHAIKRKTPRKVPEPLVQKFDLKMTSFIRAFPKSSAQRLDVAEQEAWPTDITRAGMAQKLIDASDSSTPLVGSLASFRIGQTFGMVRTTDFPKRNFGLPILLDGRFDDSPDHHSLLQMLELSLGYSLFDPGWGNGNRILLDDPYYGYAANGLRPYEPRNAWG